LKVSDIGQKPTWFSNYGFSNAALNDECSLLVILFPPLLLVRVGEGPHNAQWMGLSRRCLAREGVHREPPHRGGASLGTTVEGWGLLGTDA